MTNLPVKTVRQYSFTDYSATNPTLPLPGNRIDVELDHAHGAVSGVIDFLKQTHTDDGRLRPRTVGMDQLDASIRIGFQAPKPWTPNTLYTAPTDTVFFGNNFYGCQQNHRSTATFHTDLAAGVWVLLAGFNDIASSAVAARDAAANSAASASASATTAINYGQLAQTKAGEASASATTAINYGQLAQTKAGEASASATTAVNYGQLAQTKADEASGSATAAANSAGQAAYWSASVNAQNLLRLDAPNVGLTGAMQVQGRANLNAPSTTGSGATGTWSINVTGTAKNITDYTINQNLSTTSNVQHAQVIATDWHRSMGDTGWYNNTHSGGLFMNSAGWIRTTGTVNLVNSGTEFQVNPTGTTAEVRMGAAKIKRTADSTGFVNAAGNFASYTRDDGMMHSLSYGWLHDYFAARGECAWSTAIYEFGSATIGANNTLDVPAPYVMAGIRTQSGSNAIYVRAVKLRNY